jgi:hypothetical protein
MTVVLLLHPKIICMTIPTVVSVNSFRTTQMLNAAHLYVKTTFRRTELSMYSQVKYFYVFNGININSLRVFNIDISFTTINKNKIMTM